MVRHLWELAFELPERKDSFDGLWGVPQRFLFVLMCSDEGAGVGYSDDAVFHHAFLGDTLFHDMDASEHWFFQRDESSVSGLKAPVNQFFVVFLQRLQVLCQRDESSVSGPATSVNP